MSRDETRYSAAALTTQGETRMFILLPEESQGQVHAVRSTSCSSHDLESLPLLNRMFTYPGSTVIINYNTI